MTGTFGVSIEELIEAAVERAVERLLRPYLRRICEPEPAVYTVAQAAVVLQVSQDTVSRLVRKGVLARVPHLEGKVLIPRVAIDALLALQTRSPSEGLSSVPAKRRRAG